VNNDFHRIRRLPPYVFEQVNKLKAQARARGDDIIDFGMGNPDMPTPPHIVQKLIETVGVAAGARRLLRAPLRREAQP
jgi:alanine-synthesizing transaminase